MTPRSKIVVAAVLFSTGGAAIKWCGFDGWQLAAFRSGIACATMLLLIPEARRGWSWRSGLVGCAYAATTLLYVQANKHTTAASAIFLQSTSPLFILVLAPWLLGEHATRRDLLQMAMMGLGLVLFFVGLDQPSATAPDPRLGDVLAATCAVTWAFTVIGYRWIVARGGSVATAAASGSLTACLVALVAAQPLAAGRPVDWAVVAFLGVCQLGVPLRVPDARDPTPAGARGRVVHADRTGLEPRVGVARARRAARSRGARGGGADSGSDGGAVAGRCTVRAVYGVIRKRTGAVRSGSRSVGMTPVTV